jgi:hypothetical protein
MSETIWVRMTITISGGRADGRNWPDRWGDAIDLPAEEALPLIKAGNAIEVDPPEPDRPLPPPASLTPVPRSEPAETAAGPVTGHSWGLTGPSAREPAGPIAAPQPDAQPVAAWGPEAEPAREPAGPTPALADMDMPKPADPKQAWVDYAMAHGETEDEANMQTKAGLMQKYGGRL